MRKGVIGGVVAVVLVGAALMFAPLTGAQVRGRVGPDIDRFQQGLLLQGPGSEIGVSIRELRSDEISATRPEGVFVLDVRPESPASRAGLRAGDVVVEFDGERVRSVRQFTRLVRETPPGRAVKTAIVRDGSRQVLDVTPEQSRELSRVFPDIGREIERGMRAFPREFDFDLRVRPSRLGVTLTPLSAQLAAYFGVKEGALVSSVASDSPAAQAGIRAGDVITAIAGRTVRDPGDATAALRDLDSGSPVEIRLVREKKEMTVKATLPERRGLSTRDRIPI